MPKKTKAPDPKTEALRRQSSLNPHPENVTDALFKGSDFFDARDLVQVKYEMLRRVRTEQQSISETASAFGFSRPSFYQAQLAFELCGLGGLLPKKPGPRRSHKLSTEVVQFLEKLLQGDPFLRPAELAERVLERFDKKVHPRTVERALVRSKKKPM
jgi:transposase